MYKLLFISIFNVIIQGINFLDQDFVKMEFVCLILLHFLTFLSSISPQVQFITKSCILVGSVLLQIQVLKVKENPDYLQPDVGNISMKENTSM